MSGHEPEKVGHCICLLLIRLDNILLRSTRLCRFPPPRRRQAANRLPTFIPPRLASTEWSSGGLPGTRAAATYRVLLFLAAGCARTRAPASWSWRRRAAGGVPAISFVCSCDSTSKRALEGARSGAADVPLCSCDNTSKRASERHEAMVEVVLTEGRDRRRISVGLWLWLGVGAQVNIAGEWQ